MKPQNSITGPLFTQTRHATTVKRVEMDEKSRLSIDLTEKLNRLRWILEQPEHFIDEHFAKIRSQIDLDTEKFIDEFGKESSIDSVRNIDEANSIRTKFIEFLDTMEASLIFKLQETSAISSTSATVVSELEKRVEEFSSSIKFTDLVEMEEAYLQLALDIIDTANETEKHLLNNQTLVYLPSNKQESGQEMGNLVYLSEDFLDQNELNCLKQNVKCKLMSIHEAIQSFLNASLVIGVSQPFVLRRKLIVIFCVVNHLNSYQPSRGKILYLEGSSKAKLDISSEHAQFYYGLQIRPFSTLGDSFRESLDAILLGDVSAGFFESESFLCRPKENRLTQFQVPDSLIQSFNSLDLSENQLETLDVDQLVKCTRLQSLNLANACMPGTGFFLDFIAPLTELTELFLTLPDAPIDFDVFKSLKNLDTLGLYSANSLDSNTKRPRLTNEHFKQLSEIPKLRTLQLLNFRIESLQKQMLTEFAELKNISLTANEIVSIEDGVFEKFINKELYLSVMVGLRQNSIHSISPKLIRGLSSHRKLDFSYNRIEQLLPKVFSGFRRLEKLNLSNNSINSICAKMFQGLLCCKELDLSANRITQLNPFSIFAGNASVGKLANDSIQNITCGAFKDLPNLEQLKLDNNMIESIEAGSFEGSSKMITLSLKNNKLKSQDDQMNINLNKKRKYDIEKKRVFAGLSSLVELLLNGNQLEKIDLNSFGYLTKLSRLKLSNNRINELNDEIKPGVLTNLTELELSNNQLTRISRHAFTDSTKLRTLKLSDNKLTTFDEDFFEPFESLTQVELQNNNLSVEITAKTFSRCTLLKEINLLGNPSVRVRAFSELKSLTCIRLELREENSSSIKRFLELEETRPFFSRLIRISLVNSSISGFDAFKLDDRFSKLEELDLRGNRLLSMSRDCFTKMPGLRLLNMADNMIESLEDPALFQDLSNLKNLDLSGNNLKHIQRQLFKELGKLETLNLSKSSSLIGLDAGLFRGLFNLKNLNLAYNNITSFDLRVLYQSCRLLESLDLSNNQLDNKSINEASMSGTTAQNLKEVMLANNRLEKMDFVHNLCRLEKLDLGGNKIESVNSNGINLFGRLIKLKHVDLSNNRIESLDIKTVFSHLKSQLDYLDLSNNPFNSNMTNQCSKNCYEFIG